MTDREKKLNILNFEVSVDINECKESLLFDNETIATLDVDKYRVTIEVHGAKRIIFKNQVYKSAYNYPDELKEIIKRGNYFNNNDIEFVDNNWFEIDVYEKDTTDNMYELTHDEVLEIDIHTLTTETLKQYMINHLEYYIEDIKEEAKSNDDIDMEMEG